jgi:hypothetical protein
MKFLIINNGYMVFLLAIRPASGVGETVLQKADADMQR